MDAHIPDGVEVSDETVLEWNAAFELHADGKRGIAFENVVKVVREHGYDPSRAELQSLNGELGAYTDKIYFFVIMRRAHTLLVRNVEGIRSAFHLLDRDGNGTLERDELHAAVRTVPYDDIDGLFDELQQDGRVTVDSVVDFVRQSGS